MLQGYSDMRCFVIGEHLKHSFSPQIHALLADYSYSIKELAPDEVEGFIKSREFDALNVTIPYKKTVMPYLDDISPEAKAIGAVNTVVRTPDGKLHGYNTDYYGFSFLLQRSGITVKNKKALVLGSGGASATVCTVLRDMSAREIIVISREGENNYRNISLHSDADIIVNTTPVGMFPKNGVSPVDLSVFKKLSGVVDIIYNPARTKLLLDAEKAGIPNAGGLSMLVAQAKKAAELFTSGVLEDDITDSVTNIVASDMQNIILIGMPGCGKTTVGKILAEKLGRPFRDADTYFNEVNSMSAAEIIGMYGEKRFRELEHQTLEELGKQSGIVLATGGGAVTRQYNYDTLHQNGTVVFIERELSELATDGRPISKSKGIDVLYRERIDSYRSFADFEVFCNGDPYATADIIIEKLKEIKKGGFRK